MLRSRLAASAPGVSVSSAGRSALPLRKPLRERRRRRHDNVAPTLASPRHLRRGGGGAPGRLRRPPLPNLLRPDARASPAASLLCAAHLLRAVHRLLAAVAARRWPDPVLPNRPPAARGRRAPRDRLRALAQGRDARGELPEPLARLRRVVRSARRRGTPRVRVPLPDGPVPELPEAPHGRRAGAPHGSLLQALRWVRPRSPSRGPSSP